jgi:peptidoglycan/xylan/chitin deacetylase (PgdA/CDA1 family)
MSGGDAVASPGAEGAGRPVTDLLVLCYHGVSESWPSPAAIDPDRLHAQLRLLQRRGYEARTLSGALRDDAPRKTVVITFDDAYRSILAKGLPVLESLGFPATVFVPTDAANACGQMDWSELAQWVGTEHEQELRCMSWDELRHLSRQGWEIGSHTCSHLRLAEIETERAAAELRRSRETCEEELQFPCTSLAYPFGSYDVAVVELVAKAGYRAAVTLDERIAEPLGVRGPLEIPREAIYRSTGWPIFVAKTSRVVRRIRVSKPYASLA